MTTSELMTLPARRGRAQRLTKGQSIKIINTHGSRWSTPGASAPRT